MRNELSIAESDWNDLESNETIACIYDAYTETAYIKINCCHNNYYLKNGRSICLLYNKKRSNEEINKIINSVFRNVKITNEIIDETTAGG